MKKIAFLAVTAFIVSSPGIASADHMDDRVFTDRDPENEFFICHTDGHVNDRFVYNTRDRDFCNEEQVGHVQFLPSPEAALHVSQSKIICFQRTRLCMAPGTSYPGHRHAGVEECYVLEGDLRVGDLVMRAGDYQRAAIGSVHGVQSTEGGCLLLVLMSDRDERLES